MGVTFFIIAERPVGDTNLFAVGETLTDCRPVGAKVRAGQHPLRHLETLAREAGVRPLLEFVCEDPDSGRTEEAGQTSPGGLPISRWFTAAEGLETIRGLIDYLTVHTEAAAEVKQVIGELRQFEKVLRRLDNEGILWHLEDGSWW